MPSTGPLPSTYSDQVVAVAAAERTAMSRGDCHEYFALLAADAVFLPPNTTAKSGPELRAWLKEFLDQFDIEWLDWNDGEVVVSGNYAYHDYVYTMKSTPRSGGPPVIGHGKGLEIVRRESDGSWKIVRNIWNAVPVAS